MNDQAEVFSRDYVRYLVLTFLNGISSKYSAGGKKFRLPCSYTELLRKNGIDPSIILLKLQEERVLKGFDVSLKDYGMEDLQFRISWEE